MGRYLRADTTKLDINLKVQVQVSSVSSSLIFGFELVLIFGAANYDFIFNFFLKLVTALLFCPLDVLTDLGFETFEGFAFTTKKTPRHFNALTFHNFKK